MRTGCIQKLWIGVLRCAGEQDHDTGSAAWFAFEVDQSAIGGDDAADGGQSQAGTFAGALGGEKRFEETLAGLRVHAATIVADHQEDARKGDGTALRRHRSGDGLKLTVAGLDYDATAVGQGIAGVKHKIEEDLLGLRLVNLDQTQVWIEMELECDVLADEAGQQILHGSGNFVEAEGASLGGLRPGEDE